MKNKITNYIIIFFIFAFIGYLWEITIKLLDTKTLVNTGTMHGPWLPIYGIGAIIIILILKKFKKNTLKIFITSALSCSIIEYITSMYLEITKGLKYWDYHNYPLNINGRTSVESALLFGIAGYLIIYNIEPFLQKILLKIPNKTKNIICIILITLFIIDIIHSHIYPNIGKGITYT